MTNDLALPRLTMFLVFSVISPYSVSLRYTLRNFAVLKFLAAHSLNFASKFLIQEIFPLHPSFALAGFASLHPTEFRLFDFASGSLLLNFAFETFQVSIASPFAHFGGLQALPFTLRKIRYTFWICLYSNSTGVSRPKIETIALNFDLSG